MDPKSRLNAIEEMRGSAAILARLRWLEDRIYWTGALARGEISRRFNVSITQASNDISAYVRLAPENLIVLRDKRYGPARSFDPLFPKNARSVIESELQYGVDCPLPVERVRDPWAALDHAIVAALMTAAAAKEPLSVSTPGGRVALCPHRIVDAGEALFVHGWNHEVGGEAMWRIADLGEPMRAHTLPWIPSRADVAP